MKHPNRLAAALVLFACAVALAALAAGCTDKQIEQAKKLRDDFKASVVDPLPADHPDRPKLEQRLADADQAIELAESAPRNGGPVEWVGWGVGVLALGYARYERRKAKKGKRPAAGPATDEPANP